MSETRMFSVAIRAPKDGTEKIVEEFCKWCADTPHVDVIVLQSFIHEDVSSDIIDVD